LEFVARCKYKITWFLSKALVKSKVNEHTPFAKDHCMYTLGQTDQPLKKMKENQKEITNSIVTPLE